MDMHLHPALSTIEISQVLKFALRKWISFVGFNLSKTL
jgi:hypothetical protein